MKDIRNCFGVDLAPVERMKFHKYLDNERIAMNTYNKKERFEITNKWVLNYRGTVSECSNPQKIKRIILIKEKESKRLILSDHPRVNGFTMRSSCCNEGVYIKGNVTKHYKCNLCKKPCDTKK